MTKNLRKEYSKNFLYKEECPLSPFVLFEEWFSKAVESGLTEPNAMFLATTSLEGRPSGRTVLLKSSDTKGFVFFSNYTSQKGRELEQTPWASATFLWLSLERQLHISGWVEKISRAESEEYFSKRPRGSQLSSWASRQSREIADAQVLQEAYLEAEKRFPDTVPCPPWWGGYRIVPDRFEFWQGRKNRLHDRILYCKEGDNWNKVRLSP